MAASARADGVTGTAETPAGVTSTGNPLQAIPLARLATTRERPLFSPSRRPPPPPAAAPIYVPTAVAAPVKTEPDRPQLTLVGTIVGENDAIAVFLDKATRDVVRLHTSEGHKGWVLQSVQGREATLVKDSNSTVLALAPPGGAELTTQASAEPARRPARH